MFFSLVFAILYGAFLCFVFFANILFLFLLARLVFLLVRSRYTRWFSNLWGWYVWLINCWKQHLLIKLPVFTFSFPTHTLTYTHSLTYTLTHTLSVSLSRLFLCLLLHINGFSCQTPCLYCYLQEKGLGSPGVVLSRILYRRAFYHQTNRDNAYPI